MIFKQAGFDITLIGKKEPKWCLKRWRKIFKERGVKGLSTESRGKCGGRSKSVKNLTDNEKMKYLEAQVAYLKAENNFLSKLRKKS